MQSKWKITDTPQDSSLIPTIAVTLWLGWMGILTFSVLYAAFLATTFQRNVIISLLSVSAILPPSFPGALGVKIGNWIMHEARKYFGLKTIIENESAFHDINKSGKTAIFAIEPHDVLPYSVFAFNPCLGLIPGRLGESFNILMTGVVFKLPYMKHVYSWVGGIPVDKKTFRSQLAKNKGTGFVPGGVQEVILMDPSKPDDLVLYLKNRKGFVKLALELGNPIVPVFTFNLEQSYRSFVPRGKFVGKVARKIGFLPVFFFGRFGIPYGIPKPVKLTVVLGEPLHIPCENDNVSKESVEKYHALYLEKVVELFERHKHAQGYGHRNLVIC
jgi:1-acyl-sn-glycerol-3-phosphate acyltransferase